MSEDDFELLVDASDSLVIPVVLSATILAFIGLLIFLIGLDDYYQQSNVEHFRMGLTNAVRAYSTTYSDKAGSLESLAEGYLTKEDLELYKVSTNPIELDRLKGSQYFFSILSTTINKSEASLKSMGFYVVDVTTYFKPENNYLVSIYKNGNDLMSVSGMLKTLEDVQAFVDGTLGVTTDLANGYNESLREAQRYDRIQSQSGNGSATYSTYSTTMVIVKNVPIKSLFAVKVSQIKNIQTYSVKRGD